jgi:hypothetical protein
VSARDTDSAVWAARAAQARNRWQPQEEAGRQAPVARVRAAQAILATLRSPRRTHKAAPRLRTEYHP